MQQSTGSKGFGALAELLDAQVAAGDPSGLVALVALGDGMWVHVAGLRDISTPVPMTRDTLFAVASIGKPLTAASAMVLVEDGRSSGSPFCRPPRTPLSWARPICSACLSNRSSMAGRQRLVRSTPALQITRRAGTRRAR
jgi:hypothetical protein